MYNVRNQPLTGVYPAGGTVTPSYDAAGNMIYGPKAGDETTGLHYVYDAWNRLVAAYEDDGDGVFEPTTDDALTATYEYDGSNRRIAKTLADDAGVEYFYNQNWQILEERAIDDEGVTTAVDQYVWSARYIDAPAVRYHDGNADGDCDTSTDAGDTIRYYAGDANYNVTTTVTYGYGNTSTTEHYVYSAYGEATEYSSTWAVVGAPAESGPLYCGYMFDAETSNYLARNRYYNSSLATWISRDPIGYAGGDANLYRYVGNSPLNATDPLGLRLRVMPASVIGTIDFLTLMSGEYELGRTTVTPLSGEGWWITRSESSETLYAFDMPSGIPCCRIYVASDTIKRESAGFISTTIVKVVLGDAPAVFQGIVNETNQQRYGRKAHTEMRH